MKANKKGIAMLIVICMVLMLLILGGTAALISVSHFGTSYTQIKRARAFYAAEAGVQHALWRCRRGDYDLIAGDSDTITVQDPNYTLTVQITINPPNADGLNPISARVNY